MQGEEDHSRRHIDRQGCQIGGSEDTKTTVVDTPRQIEPILSRATELSCHLTGGEAEPRAQVSWRRGHLC